MKKKIILLVKIKVPGKPMKVIEAKDKKGWSDKAIRQFVKGIKSVYPDATVTTSTISKE